MTPVAELVLLGHPCYLQLATIVASTVLNAAASL